MNSKFGLFRLWTAELAALEHPKKSQTYNGRTVVSTLEPLTAESAALVSEKSMYNLDSTLVPSIVVESSSFLQVTRITIKAWMSLNFD